MSAWRNAPAPPACRRLPPRAAVGFSISRSGHAAVHPREEVKIRWRCRNFRRLMIARTREAIKRAPPPSVPPSSLSPSLPPHSPLSYPQKRNEGDTHPRSSKGRCRAAVAAAATGVTGPSVRRSAGRGRGKCKVSREKERQPDRQAGRQAENDDPSVGRPRERVALPGPCLRVL